MSAAPPDNRPASIAPVAYLITAVALLIVQVLLYVYLNTTGHGEQFVGLSLMLSPVTLGLFAKAAVDVAAEPQNRALATIQHQTNGVLAQKIRDGVRDVLAERDAAVTSTVAAQQITAPPATVEPAPGLGVALDDGTTDPATDEDEAAQLYGTPQTFTD